MGNEDSGYMSSLPEHVVPRHLLPYIAEVVVYFEFLSFSVRELTIALMGMREREVAEIPLLELGFRQLRGVLESQYLRRFQKDSDYPLLRDVIRRMREAEEERNRVVHSLWGIGSTGVLVRTRATAKEGRGLARAREEFDEAHLVEIVEDIRRAVQATWNLWDRLAKRGNVAHMEGTARDLGIPPQTKS